MQLARVATGQARWPRLPVDGPILAFSVWSLLSASFSSDPLDSHESAKKLVLFLLLYVAAEVMSEASARERVMDAALLGGLVLATGALLQYYLLGFDTAARRPRSFLGHYMTASGLAMGVLIVSAARLAFTPQALPRRSDLVKAALLFVGLLAVAGAGASGLFALEVERLFVAALALLAFMLAVRGGGWPTPGARTLLASLAFATSAWALLVSRTRNAWIGAVLGLTIVSVLRAPKLLVALAAGIVAVAIVRPAPVMERLSLDASSVDRYYMWQAGFDMMRDKPVFGQGPGRILAAYPAYRWPEAPNALTPHMHNNVVQIAAERGLPCLAWWIWLVAALLADAWRALRRSGHWGAHAALALLVAILAAGMFEYNFGDSEVLMFVLVVAALPYALRPRTVAVA
ncbi:MAG TPA: O-antigen ligase family protein [Vicinamibacteria bacterium]|nr:O-antigen ligase family protein [Vicinamibacteria bacterium]